MNKVLLSNKFTGGQVNKLLVERVNKRQSNKMNKVLLSNKFTGERVACAGFVLTLLLVKN